MERSERIVSPASARSAESGPGGMCRAAPGSQAACVTDAFSGALRYAPIMSQVGYPRFGSARGTERSAQERSLRGIGKLVKLTGHIEKARPDRRGRDTFGGPAGLSRLAPIVLGRSECGILRRVHARD